MTDYSVIERDFIKRTLEIIDQYEELVRSRMPEPQQFEVTLLLNCLLGLLIYPQQLAGDNAARRFDNWLTNDYVERIGPEWGIGPKVVISPGYKNVTKPEKGERRITLEELTMRNLVRQMRNNVAHAGFEVDPSSMTGRITVLEFKDPEKEDRPGGFHLVIPVDRLETFVRKFANSALERLNGHV